MRALINRPHVVSSKSRLAAVAIIMIATATGILVYSANSSTAHAAEGEPVITSLVAVQLTSGVWKLSGTISCSEGYSGMQLHFSGSLIDEDADVNPNGSFSETYSMNPGPFDWIDAQATDRWEQQSETETYYF